jgi:hypothetical protein
LTSTVPRRHSRGDALEYRRAKKCYSGGETSTGGCVRTTETVVTAREKDGGDTKKTKIARNTRVYYVIHHFILRRSTRRRACPVTRHAAKLISNQLHSITRHLESQSQISVPSFSQCNLKPNTLPLTRLSSTFHRQA